MSNTLVVTGKPAWLRFEDFQGPVPQEEREAIRLDQIKGKGFKRNQRSRRSYTEADLGAGQWGCSIHRSLR